MKKPNIKKVLSEIIGEIGGERIALLLSAGIDSHSILFECLEQGKNVVCYTFKLKDRKTIDI